GRCHVEHGPRLARERAAVAVELLVGPPVAGREGKVGRTRGGGGDRGDEQDDARCGAAEHQWRRRLFPLPATLTAAVAECGPTAIVTLAEPERRPRSRPCTRSFSAVPPLSVTSAIIPPNPADTAPLSLWPVMTWIALPSLSRTRLLLPLVANFPAGMRRRARPPARADRRRELRAARRAAARPARARGRPNSRRTARPPPPPPHRAARACPPHPPPLYARPTCRRAACCRSSRSRWRPRAAAAPTRRARRPPPRPSPRGPASTITRRTT